jgi:lipopolysaccharide heptosyltransferase I
MNILIIRVSAIGDIIHTMPSIFLLKYHFPHARIHWIVQGKAVDLLYGQPFLDHVWVLPDKFLSPSQWSKTIEVIKGVRSYRWNAIIDFQGLLKTSSLIVLLQGKKYGFNRTHVREKISTFFTHYHDAPIYTNIVQKNLSLASAAAQHLGNITKSPSLEELKQTFDLRVSGDKQRYVNEWLAYNKITNYVLLCPNTTWPSKHWPKQYWVALIELFLKSNIGITPILIGTTFGPAAQEIASRCHGKNIDIRICPAWDLLTMSYLIKQAKIIIAPDTGLLHIADFLDVPAIGIFGPTNKCKHGPFWTPISKKLSIQVECRHYYEKMHNNNNISISCMLKLNPQELFNLTSVFLKNSLRNYQNMNFTQK